MIKSRFHLLLHPLERRSHVHPSTFPRRYDVGREVDVPQPGGRGEVPEGCGVQSGDGGGGGGGGGGGDHDGDFGVAREGGEEELQGEAEGGVQVLKKENRERDKISAS